MTFTIHLIFILRIKYKKHNSFTTQSKQKICKTNLVFTKAKVAKKPCLLFKELHESKINSTKHMSCYIILRSNYHFFFLFQQTLLYPVEFRLENVDNTITKSFNKFNPVTTKYATHICTRSTLQHCPIAMLVSRQPCVYTMNYFSRILLFLDIET